MDFLCQNHQARFCNCIPLMCVLACAPYYTPAKGAFASKWVRRLYNGFMALQAACFWYKRTRRFLAAVSSSQYNSYIRIYPCFLMCRGNDVWGLWFSVLIGIHSDRFWLIRLCATKTGIPGEGMCDHGDGEQRDVWRKSAVLNKWHFWHFFKMASEGDCLITKGRLL